MPTHPKKAPTFIVDFWARILYGLRWPTPFRRLVWLSHRRGESWGDSAKFVDYWTLSVLAVAVGTFIAASLWPTAPWLVAVVVLGIWRTYELLMEQLNVVLGFDAYRAGQPYAVTGRLRLVVISLQNLVEIVFWFAATYAVLGPSQIVPMDSGPLGLVRDSFVATVSFGSAAPMAPGTWGLGLVAWQGLLGFVITLLSLARFVALLAPPTSSSD